MWDDGCFTCGQPGHYARDCPERRATAPGPWPPPPPQFKRGAPRADAHAWADRIRREMGWARRETPAERRAESQQDRARRQAAESRDERGEDGGRGEEAA